MDGYQLLANAVVEQAAEDYRKALVDQHDGMPDADAEVRSLERWFAGPVFKLYTRLDGPALAEAIKAEVRQFNYDLKALKKSHAVKE